MFNEFSIIIPTLNEEDHLPKLLQSIIKQKFTGKLQVIVVDGSSKDKTVAVAQQYKHKFADLLVLQTTRGIAQQRNFGVEKAKYNYLLFIDADIILLDRFFESISKKIKPQAMFIAAFALWGSDCDLSDFIIYTIFYPLFMIAAMIDKLTPGGLMLTTKEVHERNKGFKKGFLLGEDADYGKRAIVNGAKYFLFFRPMALHSPRRLRKVGRVNLLLFYIKTHLHMRKYKKISENDQFTYLFGHYKD